MRCPHPQTQKHGLITQMIPGPTEEHHTFKLTQPLPSIKYYGRNRGAPSAKKQLTLVFRGNIYIPHEIN